MSNIDEYYKKLKQEVETRQLANENGGSKVQIFTRYATDLLKLKGETEMVSVVYHEETNAKKLQHKINGYGIHEGASQLDLFVTVFNSTSKITYITEKEVEDAIEKVLCFFKKARTEDFIHKITESSEIFDCVHAICNDEELKENLSNIQIFVVTNNTYLGDDPADRTVEDIKVSSKVIDIEYLYQLSEDSKAPIEVDFAKRGFDKVGCVTEGEDNDTYQVYLAIIPGALLADLYEEYGVRLMENNVRQFLQATGKVNKGIKETIELHPAMFLAYNNGIAATAKDIELDKTGRYIRKITNLQIVNGGQTTASLFHTRKNNDGVDLSKVYVQVKFSVIKKDNEYKEIVEQISRCANMQNKVNEADFSANDPSLIKLEQLSRFIMVDPTPFRPTSTFWFFERSKGQYKNLRIKDGFTKTRERQFDLKYPKDQVFTKYDLAKYINSYDLKTEKVPNREGVLVERYLIGPQIVCKGNEKNYEFYLKHNFPKPKEVTNIYFEDLIAKAILFIDADHRYGTKTGEHIGDIKKTVVPYTIALLRILTEGNLDLYKIWKRQRISEALSDLIYSLMKQVDSYIIHHSPDQRFEEWGKKEECWNELRRQKWNVKLYSIKEDMIDPKNPPKRVLLSKTEDEEAIMAGNRSYVECIPVEVWEKISVWGEESGLLKSMQRIACKEIIRKLGKGEELSDEEVTIGMEIADIVSKHDIDLLYESETFSKDELQTPKRRQINLKEARRILTEDTIERMLEFEDSHHYLPEYKYKQLIQAEDDIDQLSNKMIIGLAHGYYDLVARGFKG